MTDIYLRHHSQASGAKVGEVPFDKAAVDAVIPLLAAWGVTTDLEDLNSDLVGQFVLDGHHAYFEVVIGGEDE